MPLRRGGASPFATWGAGRDRRPGACLALPCLLALAACGPSATPEGPADAAGAADAADAAPVTVCRPGEGRCDGDVSRVCRPDGSGWGEVPCDPVQDVRCAAATGLCEGACAPAALGDGTVGCEYYPTVTANPVDSNFHFAVAVANAGAEPVQVTLDGGDLAAPLVFAIPSGGVEVRTLDWVQSLKACTSHDQPVGCGAPTARGALARGGAYRLRATRPVTVYQFNPLEHQLGTQRSYTNDASLLVPQNALSGRYVVASWPAWDTGGGWPVKSPGLLAVTATRDDTAVTVTTRAATDADGGAPAFAAGVAQTVMLDRGDVLELLAFEGDLTGSQVTADRPVQVIAGHYCSEVPQGIAHCDHLEESMFPVEALGADYVVTAPAVPALPDGKVEVVRIVATQAATTLAYDPPRAAPTQLAAAGDFVEIAGTADSFAIHADHKVVVAQYMEGDSAGGLTGDPAMTLAVPTPQYRPGYRFHAPLSYPTSYVDVVAPLGAQIVLDGAPLGALSPIGGTGLGVARVPLGTGDAGNHAIAGDQPFGISVYGYGPTTSYWYPGGLDLETILIP